MTILSNNVATYCESRFNKRFFNPEFELYSINLFFFSYCFSYMKLNVYMNLVNHFIIVLKHLKKMFEILLNRLKIMDKFKQQHGIKHYSVYYKFKNNYNQFNHYYQQLDMNQLNLKLQIYQKLNYKLSNILLKLIDND